MAPTMVSWLKLLNRPGVKDASDNGHELWNGMTHDTGATTTGTQKALRMILLHDHSLHLSPGWSWLI